MSPICYKEGKELSVDSVIAPRHITVEYLLTEGKSPTTAEIGYMLGLQRLTFRDLGLETCFRSHWAASSRTLISLLSLLTLLIWSVATWNVHTHCKWSRFLCSTLEVISVCVVMTHAYFQYQLRKYPMWNLEELNKAYVFIADLVASMVFVLLLEDWKEVPGGTHDWMYCCHGWAILFLQVTTVSAFHLHLLNLLAYCIVEVFLAHEFGWSGFVRGGLKHLFAVFALCCVVPMAINGMIETQSRREFLRRHRMHAAARREWLCPN